MITEKTYIKVNSIEEACQLAAENTAGFKFIAGGTDVIVNQLQGTEEPDCLIDITGIEELKSVTLSKKHLRIGALVTLHELGKSKEIRDEFPLLLEAAQAVGSPLIRKTATIGGNILCQNRCYFYNQHEWWRKSVGYCLKCDGDICIASGGRNACFSECVSDTAPALISMQAELEIYDVDGEKQIPLADIYSGDGVEPLTLSRTAIVKSIMLPLNQEYKAVFKKLRQRESLEFTSLSTAVAVNKFGLLRICMTGVDPKPVLVEAGRGADQEELIKKAIRGSRAIDNEMLSRAYRREMIKVFLKESFDQLL